jgi:magnesium transporter
MVTTAISVNLSLIALQESENTKRLAAYAALAAVPTMIAGVYGMNFQHMPELTWVTGYPMALGLMFILDMLLFLQFRRIRWL